MKYTLKAIAAVLAITSVSVYAGGDPEHVKFPADYNKTFTQYATMNRANQTQVAKLYANEAAIAGYKQGNKSAPGGVVPDHSGTRANRNDPTAPTQRSLSLSHGVADLSRSADVAPVSAAVCQRRPGGLRTAARRVADSDAAAAWPAAAGWWVACATPRGCPWPRSSTPRTGRPRPPMASSWTRWPASTGSARLNAFSSRLQC